jgi:uncharacterized protein YegP (UPF0339 family)
MYEAVRRSSGMEGAKFYVYQDRAGTWRWQLVRADSWDVLADSAEGYESEEYAYQVVNWIRLNAAKFPILPGELS